MSAYMHKGLLTIVLLITTVGGLTSLANCQPSGEGSDNKGMVLLNPRDTIAQPPNSKCPDIGHLPIDDTLSIITLKTFYPSSVWEKRKVLKYDGFHDMKYDDICTQEAILLNSDELPLQGSVYYTLEHHIAKGGDKFKSGSILPLISEYDSTDKTVYVLLTNNYKHGQDGLGDGHFYSWSYGIDCSDKQDRQSVKDNIFQLLYNKVDSLFKERGGGEHVNAGEYKQLRSRFITRALNNACQQGYGTSVSNTTHYLDCRRIADYINERDRTRKDDSGYIEPPIFSVAEAQKGKSDSLDSCEVRSVIGGDIVKKEYHLIELHLNPSYPLFINGVVGFYLHEHGKYLSAVRVFSQYTRSKGNVSYNTEYNSISFSNMEDCNDGRVYRFMRETTDAYYSEKAEGKLRIERVYVGGSDRVKQTLSKHVYDAHRDEFVGTVIKECVSWMTKDSDKGEDSDKNSDRSASDIVTLPVTAHASGSTDTKDDGGRLSTSNKVSAAPPTKQNEFDAPLVPDTPNIVGNVSALSAEMGLSDINTQNSHDQSHHLRDIILPFIAPQVASKVALPDSIWLSGPHEIYAFNGGYTNDDGKPGQYFLSIIPHYSPTKYPHRSAATVMYADNNSSMSKMHIVTNCFDIPGDNIDGGVYRNSCSKESSKDMCVEENMSQCNHSGSDERNEEIVKEHILILRDCMPYYLTSNKVRSTISETLSRFYSRDIIESGA